MTDQICRLHFYSTLEKLCDDLFLQFVDFSWKLSLFISPEDGDYPIDQVFPIHVEVRRWVSGSLLVRGGGAQAELLHLMIAELQDLVNATEERVSLINCLPLQLGLFSICGECG